jgi:NAD(P)-dependent dehydrogenase (short-subunit alcohol dehydrogenase family)
MAEKDHRIAVVTGANTGLGFETCLRLAKAGFTVVMACRSEAKGNKAARRIQSRVRRADLVVMHLDLADRDSIRRFAAGFTEQFDHLNLLINNAGIMGPPHTITKNRVELQFDVNHLGHFLLTHLLMPGLDQEFETRVINVSSLTAKDQHADICFCNLNFDGNYDEGPAFRGLTGMGAYAQSKLANILFTVELKYRLAAADKKIKAIVVHPGASNTRLSRYSSPFIRLLAPLLVPFKNISTPAEGAEPTLFAALDPDIVSGAFIGPTGKGELTGKPGRCRLPSKAADKPCRRKLWNYSEDLLKVEFKM